MTLFDKIMAIYPSLSAEDFNVPTQKISLRNDANNEGDYIAKWEHPDFSKPTDVQLNGEG
jgi:hypothetical protein